MASSMLPGEYGWWQRRCIIAETGLAGSSHGKRAAPWTGGIDEQLRERLLNRFGFARRCRDSGSQVAARKSSLQWAYTTTHQHSRHAGHGPDRNSLKRSTTNSQSQCFTPAHIAPAWSPGAQALLCAPLPAWLTVASSLRARPCYTPAVRPPACPLLPPEPCKRG